MTGQYRENAEGVDVRYVANLARLDLTDEEVELFQGQLENILGYVEQLQELNVDGIEPTAHAISVDNVFRRDEALLFEGAENIPKNFPAENQQLVSVPKIIE